ncbi:molecular chaperone DnaK [Duganella sp. BJB488]|uniref:Hsp70 family protein n=1 Tax=unclassified Duganella TaxID=2636909 RepID=UPI000E345C19|nr:MULTISPECIES: Hsp70 family protein [unclassified Duganella]RFP20483.1 molecular chaperone DnaK [Duganella sp. BJB489]RFP21080.1 molecular chaperone DnaK [Duganella sp. BJB488]RFP33216.1 molecular chaperone DnaK [Duganella sp. BJB480]
MSQYVVSIDLGTTNTVLAYSEPDSAQIRLFEIEQLVAPGEVGAGALLPSMRYHPAQGELADGDLQLPWPSADVAGLPQVVVGRLARTLGAQVPGRLVSSAKSWLSHPQVDRMAPILPWGAEPDVAKVSPVAASASYLAHVRAAWNARFPAHPLEHQQLVLTIPASFDEGARALTLEAARSAGLPDLRLLEEPQAAFYDWLFRQRATLAADLADTRLVLVCDVGGGTTDFSLIKVEMIDGQPQISRIGVGNHLILGGDNMDLALAHLVEARMAGGDGTQARLSASRLSQLAERCRAAKELLLAADAPERTTVTLLGSGSRLIGSSRSAELTRDEVAALVVDGFFPLNAAQEPAQRGRGAIVEFGLPYASDAAITRHLASFLHQHAAAAREALGIAADDRAIPIPDTLLLNGGVFRAHALAARLEVTLANWRGQPLTVLHNDNPDVAVARGGVAYALGQAGQAPVIGGGSPRSYFLLLDDEARQDKPRRAICILPRGSVENREILLADRTFALRLGRPVRFHLASSISEAAPPQAGELVELQADEYIQLPPIATVLRDSSAADARKEIPVQLAATLSEVGTLDVHCVAIEGAQRWLLEFQLRGVAVEEDSDTAAPKEAPMPAGFDAAVDKIDRIFGSRAQQVDIKEVKQLRTQLEHLLGSRESWATPLLRRLFDALMQRAKGRRRSSEHERAWLNLSGYCLRPGFGYTLDEWRIEQLWAMFDTGVQHHKDSQVCAEWWTLWRRVAGGLSVEAQLRVLDDFAFNVQADDQERGRRPQTLVNGSEEDMLRLGASLERIPGGYKAEIGAWMLGRLEAATKAAGKAAANKTRSGAADAGKAEAAQARFLWGLSRVGARQPFHGSAHDVVESTIVEQWLAVILSLDWKKVEPAGYAATHLARMTGDRSRDIGEALRAEILRRLAAVGAPASWSAMVREVVQLDQADEKRMLGEALPPGLKLIA